MGNVTIPIARGTTERTRPAVSSPEASRTPAARVRGKARAAGVREPLTIAPIRATSAAGRLTHSQRKWLCFWSAMPRTA